MHKVFTDWLDVTYAPDDVPEPELRVLLLGCGFDLVREFGGADLPYLRRIVRGHCRHQ